MADTTTPSTETPPEIQPPAINPPEVRRSLAVEEDDPPEEPEIPSTLQDDGATSELNVESLSISEPNSVDEPKHSHIQAVTSGDTPYTSAKRFEDLNLSPELLEGLYIEMGFERPSNIQAVSLPMILTPPYKNLIAQAHNGSGKTTCFVLGLLSRVDPKLNVPQALCICPSRELAFQNMEVLQKMGKYTGISSECAVPMDATQQITKRAPVTAQIVIGTPGTIKKWMLFKKLSISYLKILVFDEADQMLVADGFKDDSLKIMKDIERSSANCQVLLFTATFNETVKNFVTRIVKDYNQMFVKKEELSLEAVKHDKVSCPDELSKGLVIKDKILESGEKVGQTIAFVPTRNSASMLHKAPVDYGYEATTIQGAPSQEYRDKIIKEFKDGLTQVLISTDLLARGFDQSQVNVAFFDDLPVKYESPSEPDYEVYLHRIGGAGRFGRKGAVFDLPCSSRDIMHMEKIDNHFGTQVAEYKGRAVVDDPSEMGHPARRYLMDHPV